MLFYLLIIALIGVVIYYIVIVFNYSYTTFNPSLPYLLINEVFENTSLEIYDTAAWKKKSCVPLSGHPNRLTRIVEMVYIFAK